MLYFFERHWEELLKFSRRTEAQLQQWAARYGYKDQPREILEHAKKGYGGGRYSCVNLQNRDTVEFRMKLPEAAKKVEDSVEETLTYASFPFEHWTRIRTNNVIERLNREIRRRTRVVGCFPDGNSALMLVCARLRHEENAGRAPV